MSDEEPRARDQLFWALVDHSNIDTARLRALTNAVSERTAHTLYQSTLRALAGDSCSSAIDLVVAQLEHARALQRQVDGDAQGMHAAPFFDCTPLALLP